MILTRQELEQFNFPPHRWKGNHNLIYSEPSSLQKTILYNPLRTNDVDSVLSRTKIEWWSFGGCCSPNKEPLTWIIRLNPTDQELPITLIHEVAHAYYRAGGGVFPRELGGYKTEAGEIEELIENEAQLFYKENEKFVNIIVDKIIF